MTNSDGALVNEALQIENCEAVGFVCRLMRQERLFLGATSRTNVASAERVAREPRPINTVVTMLCGRSAKYQSHLFNPEWPRMKGRAADDAAQGPSMPIASTRSWLPEWAP